MRSRACRRTVPVMVLLLAALLVVTAGSAAWAQAPTAAQPAQAPPTARPGTVDDDAGNWGLLGLLGLVGLAGLIPRNRTRPIDRTGRP
jgi:hypothetical protein